MLPANMAQLVWGQKDCIGSLLPTGTLVHYIFCKKVSKNAWWDSRGNLG